MQRVPTFVAGALALWIAAQVVLGGPRIEAAFEAGVIVGAGLVLAQSARS